MGLWSFLVFSSRLDRNHSCFSCLIILCNINQVIAWLKNSEREVLNFFSFLFFVLVVVFVVFFFLLEHEEWCACLHKASSKQPHCCEIQSSPFYSVTSAFGDWFLLTLKSESNSREEDRWVEQRLISHLLNHEQAFKLIVTASIEGHRAVEVALCTQQLKLQKSLIPSLTGYLTCSTERPATKLDSFI